MGLFLQHVKTYIFCNGHENTSHNIMQDHSLPTMRVATPHSVGVKPNTCKVGDLESSETLACSKLDSKAQTTSH
jgi:hypothetical protein